MFKYLFVLSLHAVVFCTRSHAAAAGSLQQPACALNVRGGAAEPITIDLSCAAPGLRVSTHPEWADLQRGSSSQGFAVDPTCSTKLPRGCLFTLCGHAHFSGCSVTGVETPRLSAILCVSGSSSSVTFHNCSFTNNTAHNSTLHVADTAFVTLLHSSIRGSRGRHGGAVQVTGRATLHLNSSTLSSNAGQQGGALFASEDAHLVFTGSSLSNNKVPPRSSNLRGSCAGAGVLLEGRAQLVLINSSFLNNSALCDVPRGGALTLRNSSKVHAIGLEGVGSMAGSIRGRSLIANNLAQSTNQLGVNRVRIRRNTDTTAAPGVQDSTQGTFTEAAAAAGGGIAASDNTTLLLTDLTLLNNSVTGRGTVGGAGLVASAFSRVELGPSVVVAGNVANGTVTYGAGAWLGGQSRALLKDGVQIKGNIATGDVPNGGGVALQDSSELVATGALLESNAALGPDAWAGAILAEQRSRMTLGPGTQLLNNRAVGDSTKGGAVVLTGHSRATMTGVTLQGNHVGESGPNIMGGAIYTTQAAVLSLNSCSLLSNVANGQGAFAGAVAADAALGLLVVTNHTLFDSNAVNGSFGKGGAVWTQVPTVINASCSFVNNTVTGDDSSGGALWASCGQACSGGGVALNLSDISFTRNSASGQGCMGGAVYLLNAVNLTALGVRFTFNTVTMPSSRGGFGGALEFYGNGNGVVNITGAVIDSCSAHQGGGMSLEQPLTAYLTNVTITNCTTTKDGGGLFVQNPRQAVVLTRVNLTGNTAGYKAPNTPDDSAAHPGAGGGLNAWSITTLLLLEDCTFVDNRATMCGGIAAGRTRAVLTPDVRVTHNTAEDHGGGMCVSSGGTLQLTSANASASSRLAQRDAAVNTSEEDKQQLMRMVYGNNAPDGADIWWTQMCPSGFVRSVDAECRPCDRDSFSFTSNAGDTCRPCPAGAICPGRDLLLPQPGFWHSTNQSTNFRRCPEPEACALPILGVNTSILICKQGHQGNLCGECVAEWGLQAPFTCARCTGYASSIAAYAAAVVALVALTYWLWVLTMAGNAKFTNEVLAEDVLKVLTVYAQSMYIVSKAKVTWPDLLRSFSTPFAFAFTGGTSIMPISCLLPSVEPLSMPGPYLLLLAQLLMPIGLVAGAMLVKVAVSGGQAWCVWCRGGGGGVGDASPASPAGMLDKSPEAPPRALSPTLAQQAWVLFLVVMFLSYPTLVNVALSLFACHKLDAPPPPLYPEFAVANATWGYWENQMSQACYEGRHKWWALALGAPLGLLLVVVWPAYVLVLLLRKRRAEAMPRFRMLYGFIYRAYRKKRRWWSSVVVVHMAILVWVSTFLSVLGAYYCTLLLSMLFGTMLGLVLLFRPFQQSRLNWLKMASMACLWLTSNATLAFMPGPVGYSLSDTGKNVLGVFMLLVNVIFLVAAFLLLFHYGFKEGRVHWLAAVSWVRAKSGPRRRPAAIAGSLQGVVSNTQLPSQGAQEPDAVAVDIDGSSSDHAPVRSATYSRGQDMSPATC